jgi:hypothetical protein
MDNDLRISDELSVEDVYVLYGFYNGMFFVAKDDMTYIVSEAGDAIAEIEASRNSQLLGNILYDQQESSFLAIDLGQILIHEPL